MFLILLTVNELLSQTTLDAGKLVLQAMPFAPADIAHQVHGQMYILAQSKGIKLTTEIDDTMPDTLIGDPARLKQILANLVSNAIKFTEAGNIHIRLYQNTTHWALQVSDSGSGIPKEAQVYIFEPFRQVDGSMTRRHSGAGLGLSIVKQLVDLMKGEIRLDSEIDRGTTFLVLLPLKPAISEKSNKVPFNDGKTISY